MNTVVFSALFIVIVASTAKAIGIKMNDDLTDDLSDDSSSEEDQEQYDKDLPKGQKSASNKEVRNRIEELLEQKRLKALLDDADDWDF